jgi:hypothetical protein
MDLAFRAARMAARLVLALAPACALGACSAQDAMVDAGIPATPAISFDVDGGVLLAQPNAIVTVSLTTQGPVDAVVLALDGAYGDASLDRTSAAVKDGKAQFQLRTPTTPATFAVQAVAGSARARLDVSVSRDGFATIRVTPAYKGKRPVPIVAASTFLKTKCNELGTFPAKDGSPLVVGTNGEVLVVSAVPAGASVAVAVRIARYATGCVDVDALAPNTTRDVTVQLYDLPLNVTKIDLNAGFTFDLATKDRTALTNLLTTASSQALTSFFPDTEPKRLLDAMNEAVVSSNDKAAFAAKRTQSGWDAQVGTWLAARPPTMQTRVTSWLAAAAPKLPGELRGHLVGTASDKATFAPLTFGGLDATQTVLVKNVLTLGADADDTLKLNGDVIVWPSRLLAVAAAPEAKADFPASTSVPSALALAVDCQGLGAALAIPSYAFGTCDGACVANLCKQALVTRWEAAAASSEKQGNKLDLSFTASAATQFDDDAIPQSYNGSWVGQLGSGIPAKGLATAIPNGK